MRARLAALGGLASSCLLAAMGQPAFEVVDLGTLGGRSSRATGVNDRGMVVGEAETAKGRLHAFAWTEGGGMRDLGDLGGGVSVANGVNEGGLVVGEAEDSNGVMRAFAWSEAAGISAIDAHGSVQSYAHAVNRDGIIVGAAEFPEGRRAVIWSNGVGMAVGGLGEGDSEACDVNDGDVVAGRRQVGSGDDAGSRGFVYYSRSTDAALASVEAARPDGRTAALAVNNLGQVTGYGEDADGRRRVILYEPVRGMRVLDTGGNAYSEGRGINDGGAIVGAMLRGDADDDHALLWKDGDLHDLNELIDPDADWVLLEARDINTAGWIVGRGLLDGRERAFLLRPVRAERLDVLPSVSIAVPPPDSTYREPATILVGASATSPEGVRRVVFHANGSVIGSDSEPPFEILWTNVPAGEYGLTATASGHDGALRRSARVRVRVEMPADRRPPGADAQEPR
jgi:probable HAF family extracellular repeat protein